MISRRVCTLLVSSGRMRGLAIPPTLAGRNGVTIVRIAVAIIGLMLWFVFLIQAILVSALGDMANDDSSSQGGAVGVLVAILWLVSVALVFAFPRVSTGLFIAAGALAW